MSHFIDFIVGYRVQVFSSAGSLALIIFIVSLIRKMRLKEEYAILWLVTAGFLFLVSIYKPILDYIASFLGIHYAPAAILLLLILAMIIILIHYSTVLSKLSKQNKLLAQELAILKHNVKKGNQAR